MVEVGGDVITAIDGTPVLSFDDLLIYLSLNTSPGQTVTLTILRGGETLDVQVTLVARPSN
jgi:S1-C subfamily serine protease